MQVRNITQTDQSLTDCSCTANLLPRLTWNNVENQSAYGGYGKGCSDILQWL